MTRSQRGQHILGGDIEAKPLREPAQRQQPGFHGKCRLQLGQLARGACERIRVGRTRPRHRQRVAARSGGTLRPRIPTRAGSLRMRRKRGLNPQACSDVFITYCYTMVYVAIGSLVALETLGFILRWG